MPATTVPFDQIDDAELARNESFFEDSTIELTLKDGSVVSFPVSSELDRDVLVFEAIMKAIGKEVDAEDETRVPAEQIEGPVEPSSS